MQNLYDSHDAQRLSSAAANPDLGHFANWGDFFGKSQAERNSKYNTSKPNEAQLKDMKLMIAFQMCMPGAPVFCMEMKWECGAPTTRIVESQWFGKTKIMNRKCMKPADKKVKTIMCNLTLQFSITIKNGLELETKIQL
ncbi:MAG: hypothetical protein IPP71_20095 [Bacteroidetes bacterium]|nr:hypothetical protein [Bacteroidota bacterium]